MYIQSIQNVQNERECEGVRNVDGSQILDAADEWAVWWFYLYFSALPWDAPPPSSVPPSDAHKYKTNIKFIHK